MLFTTHGIELEIDKDLFQKYLNVAYPGAVIGKFTEKEQKHVDLIIDNFVLGYFRVMSFEELSINKESRFISSSPVITPQLAMKDISFDIMEQEFEKMISTYIDRVKPGKLSSYYMG